MMKILIDGELMVFINFLLKNNSLFKDIEIGTYPLYHSSYETFHLVSEIMDPTFNVIYNLNNYELAKHLQIVDFFHKLLA